MFTQKVLESRFPAAKLRACETENCTLFFRMKFASDGPTLELVNHVLFRCSLSLEDQYLMTAEINYLIGYRVSLAAKDA